MRVEDEACFQLVAEAAKTLSAPLSAEQLEIQTRAKDGKRGTEVIQLGSRVESYIDMIDKEEARMHDLWKQWDDVQNEYLDLGVEVFGRDVFGVDATGVDTGFHRDTELMELELKTRIEEMEEEIESIGPEIEKKMKASEKVCNPYFLA